MTTELITDLIGLNKAARDLSDATETYEDLWSKAQQVLHPLDPSKFEVMLTHFHDCFSWHVWTDRYPSKTATYEFFRRQAIDQEWTLHDMCCFVYHWDAIVDGLHGHLFEIVTDKGDDGYGDLCDSLPLIGRDALKRLFDLKEGFANNNDVVQIIKEACPEEPKSFKGSGNKWENHWKDFIWRGENYFRMHMNEVAREWYLNWSRDNKVAKKTVELV